MLKLEDDDVIEIFKECKGGGPVPRKIILNSEIQIRDALNESFDELDSAEGQSEEKLENVPNEEQTNKVRKMKKLL